MPRGQGRGGACGLDGLGEALYINIIIIIITITSIIITSNDILMIVIMFTIIIIVIIIIIIIIIVIMIIIRRACTRMCERGYVIRYFKQWLYMIRFAISSDVRPRRATFIQPVKAPPVCLSKHLIAGRGKTNKPYIYIYIYIYIGMHMYVCM